MAKNSFCHPSFPEEETIPHHFHATESSSMQLQDYALEFQEAFEGFAELDDKTAAASSSSQSHRQAEKRRRDRINAQLSKLRRLVPKSDKMDKAALLEKVVEEVKDLKRKTIEIGKFLTVPTESDDITIEFQSNNMQGFPTFAHHNKENHHNNNDNNNDNNNIMLIKATFCCEDRPDLIPEIISALKDLNLSIVGAEIASLGGRLKSILLLYYKLDHGVCNYSGIKQSLMAVLNRVISWSSASTSNFRVTSKRQRFFFSSN